MLGTGIVFMVAGCGGGGDSKQDVLSMIPIGCTLNLNMPNSEAPFVMSMDVLANNAGNIRFNSRTGVAAGTATFSYVNNGSTADFATGFSYADGTFIDVGPTIVTHYNEASITAVLDLPDDMDSRSYFNGIRGSCTYKVTINSFGKTTLDPSGVYEGTGTYTIQGTEL